ncbi:MAG: N-acetylmuramoyl-L-alanine amidase [Saprospiraceae bacterium]|nr:N-acetylmuramoyl-L-alanine amidase [Saprospiraceae bacterium]
MKNILSEKLPVQTSRPAQTRPAFTWFNVFLLILFWAPVSLSAAKIIKQNHIEPHRMRTVVIDAGHGGHDPGCLGSDSREKHIALAVAKRLAAVMQAAHPDLRIILTRDSDVFIPLHERAAIANRNNADLFISIHCNFMPGRASVQGSETYVMGLHTAEHNLSVAKRENAAILLEDDYEKHYDYDPNSPEGHIMISMFQNAFIEQSIIFADLVEKQFAQIGRKSRGVRQAGFVVLKGTAMPSALIEIGFLSNKDEENFLKKEDGQTVISDAILNAFTQYRAQLEGGEATLPPKYDAPPRTVETASKPPVPEAPKSVAVNSKPQGIPLDKIEAAKPMENVAPPPQPATRSASWPETDAPKVIGVKSPAEPPAPMNARTGAAGTNNVQFCVQLAAAAAPADLSRPEWENVGYKIEEVKEDNRYKYQIRNIATYTQAQEVKTRAQARGFSGAFITAYRNGARISVEEALRHSN